MKRLCPGIIPGEVYPCAQERAGTRRGTSCERDGYRYCVACKNWAKHNVMDAIHGTQDRMIVYGAEGLIPKNMTDYYWAKSKKKDSEAWQKAETWNPSYQNMYLYGATGRGKTFLARSWLIRCIHRGFSVAEIKGSEFHDANRSINFAKPWVERLTYRGVLLLDDLHDALSVPIAQKELALMNLKALLDKRYECELRTIITTNLSGKEFVALMERCQGDDKTVASTIVDRLKPSLSIEMTGESMRGMK